MAYAKGCTAAVFLAAISACAFGTPSRAQDLGFGLGDGYRYYADPGNGGGSAYTPFFDPYRGNRIVRGAYPDAYYDGYGFHYGKSAPPSLYIRPETYDPDPISREPKTPLHSAKARSRPRVSRSKTSHGKRPDASTEDQRGSPERRGHSKYSDERSK